MEEGPSLVGPPGRRAPVYVVDAGLQDGAITDRPRTTLDQQCLEAATQALRDPARRGRVEAIYFGTMGVFRGVASGRLAPAHVPNFLRRQLGLGGLRGSGYHTYLSTSEAGAVALIKAYQDLEDGRFQTVLVVAGEQMFSVDPARRAEDRADIAHWIRSVVDPAEADLYGLTMPWIGNLIMDHLAWLSGFPAAAWRDVLETVTLDKYQFSHLYPTTMQAAKERGGGNVTDARRYRDPEADPWVTPWFRRDDLCANANGATAVLLTTDRSLCAGAQRIRVAGMGEGHTSVALGARSGPFGRFSAIRRAYRGLCHALRVDPSLLWDGAGAATVTGMFHDAFPSIEIAFLHELGRLAAPGEAWRWAAERLVRGWSNPLGGLCASGHALGNSGLFQIAKAFHVLSRDARYLALGQPGAAAYEAALLGTDLYLVTSVGSALTNVVATLMFDEENPRALARLDDARHAYDGAAVDRAFGRPGEDPRFGPAARALGEGEALVVARTQVRLGGATRWLHLVARPGGHGFALGPDGAEPAPIGARVRTGERDGRQVVEAVGEVVVAAPEAPPGDIEAVGRAVAEVRGGRLAGRYAG